jgi:DNA-binding transcriptional MerR regulator
MGGRPLKFYDTKEASEKLQISIHTLRKYLNRGWVKAGRLPGGTIYRFTERQLEEAVTFMEEGGRHEEVDAAVSQCGAIR